jgi:hypothetical protein
MVGILVHGDNHFIVSGHYPAERSHLPSFDTGLSFRSER